MPKQIAIKRGKISQQLVDFYPFSLILILLLHLSAFITLALRTAEAALIKHMNKLPHNGLNDV